MFVLGSLLNVGAQEECSVATLHGEYLVTGAAEARFDQRDDPSFPRRNMELWKFDGAGEMENLRFVLNNGGTVGRGSGRASYTVDPDLCTAFLEFRNGVQFELFLTRDGHEGAAIRVDVDDEGRAVVATRSIKKR